MLKVGTKDAGTCSKSAEQQRDNSGPIVDSESISTNGFNRPNNQTWHRLVNRGIGGGSEVRN